MDALSTQWLRELDMEDVGQREMDKRGDQSLDEFSFKCFSPEAVYSHPAYINGDVVDPTGDELQQHHHPLGHNNNNNDGEREGEENMRMMMNSEEGVNCYLSSLSNSQSSEENLMDSSNNTTTTNTTSTSGKSCKRVRTNPKKVCSTTTTRAPLQAQNHILAERKRRERLNQRIICLSTLIPGLKRMDKASILEDAIKYIKQLKERVQTFEKEDKKKKTVEPTVFPVKKTSRSGSGSGSKKQQQKSSGDNDNGCASISTVSSEENIDENFKQLLSPEIEARVSSDHNNQVLIRIHLDKLSVAPDFPVKLLCQFPDLHLHVVTSIVLPFANDALDITIIAQMDDEFQMTAKDIVEKLRLAVVKIM